MSTFYLQNDGDGSNDDNAGDNYEVDGEDPLVVIDLTVWLAFCMIIHLTDYSILCAHSDFIVRLTTLFWFMQHYMILFF